MTQEETLKLLKLTKDLINKFGWNQNYITKEIYYLIQEIEKKEKYDL